MVQGMQAVSEAEAAANEKRREESGNKGNSKEWHWTLNWDRINDNIIVGSCPRSPSDVDRLVDEAGIDAIICLQSELCHEALQIEWKPIRERAIARGATITRVAVRDFDHGDQALMLPEAVRTLHLLLSMGKKVYVHCTAGINRATLTVVGYLTFVEGMDLDSAVEMVKTRRPQAHPYIDCWKTVRGRLLEGRDKELTGLAKQIYRQRVDGGKGGNSSGDWAEAERTLIQEGFKRQQGCGASLMSAVQEIHEMQLEEQPSSGNGNGSHNGSAASEDLEAERARFRKVERELQDAQQQVAFMRQAADSSGSSGDSEAVYQLDALQSARRDIAALRTSINKIAHKNGADDDEDVHLLSSPHVATPEASAA